MASDAKRINANGLLAALFYGVISILITLFNKVVLSSYNFSYPNLMTLSQMTVSLGILTGAKLAGWIDFPLSLSVAKSLLPLAFSFSSMVVTGLASLYYLNLPMYNALRRGTTLIAMYSEMWLLGSKRNTGTQLAVWLQVIGAAVAGLTDLDYSPMGYFLVFLNCLMTAAYLLCIRKLGAQEKAGGSWGQMFYNNLLSWPVVFLLAVFYDEFEAVKQFDYLYDSTFRMAFFVMCVQAFLLNVGIFYSTKLNSALTTSVTGQIKSIFVTLIGFVAFADYSYNHINMLGLLLGTVGSAWYAYEGYISKNPKRSALPVTVQETNADHSK